MGLIRAAQNWCQLRAPVTRVTYLQVALKDGHFLPTSFSVPFSSTTRMSDRGSKYCPTHAAMQGQRNCAGNPIRPRNPCDELIYKCICTCAHPLSIQAVNLSEEWKKGFPTCNSFGEKKSAEAGGREGGSDMTEKAA